MNIALLREQFESLSISGLIVPTVDEYQNEYVAPYAKRLEWVSGFSGSTGLALILKDIAILFVDGRYILQAKKQVNNQQFLVDSLTEKDIFNCLQRYVKSIDIIGYCPELHTMESLDVFDKCRQKSGFILKMLSVNPIDHCWHDQPKKPSGKVVEQPLCYAGKTSLAKCQDIGVQMEKAGADVMLVTAPDNIAWLLNIRGKDIPYFPIVLSRAILYADGTLIWFIDEQRVDVNSFQEQRNHVHLCPENIFECRVKAFTQENVRFMINKRLTPLKILSLLKQTGVAIIDNDLIDITKACKNEIELVGARAAHLRDGVALVKFLSWFEKNAGVNQLTELDAVNKLKCYRQKDKLFQQDSFQTISSSAAHGAIIHYRVSKESNISIVNNSLYLVDSGGQYLDGTTDVTRTIAVGEITNEQKRRFTQVLQGHISLATSRFPQGTTGHQLDVIARRFLWNEGVDYPHGTGHGVGSYLSVHEGPQRISFLPNQVALQPGMILSNEPGFYKTGEYGIRIENLLVVKRSEEYNGFLEFETLTLAPIDHRLIDTSLLSPSEVIWVDQYHQCVYQNLSAHLDPSLRQWLKRATVTLSVSE